METTMIKRLLRRKPREKWMYADWRERHKIRPLRLFERKLYWDSKRNYSKYRDQSLSFCGIASLPPELADLYFEEVNND